jgi:mycothiol synthase
VGAGRVHGSLLIRPARPADVKRVLEVIIARDVTDLGEPDFTLDDLADEWADEAFALELDSRVAESGDGELLAYAAMRDRAQLVAVHPGAEGRGIGAALLRWAEGRAAERDEPLRQDVGSSNAAAAALLTAAGYGPTHHYWRMTRALDPPLPEPSWPAGTSVRTLRVGDGADERAVHALVQEAFAGTAGNVPERFDPWRRRVLDRETADAELFFVAERDGRVAGVSLCDDWAAEQTGYVRMLATSPRDRGIGLGRALLLESFAAFHRRGRPIAALSVNAGNAGALRLYESVGMREHWRVDRWERPADAVPIA